MISTHYNRYSQHAKRSLTQSHLFAREYGHGAVDTDHLFIGILSTEGSLGQQILDELGISRSHAEFEVRSLHPTMEPDDKHLPFTDSVRESLIMAVAEAQALDCHYIGTEHILLGLVRSGRGQLELLLNYLDVSTEQIRGRVKRLIQQGQSEITIETMRRMAKLSELGRRVLNASSQIAKSHDQKSLFPEHILLALTQERRSVAKKMLIECHCDIDRLKSVIPRLPRHSIEAQTVIDQVLDRALDRAEAMGSHYTGTEHILLAMTMNRRAQHMLAEYGIDISQLQILLHEVLLK